MKKHLFLFLLCGLFFSKITAEEAVPEPTSSQEDVDQKASGLTPAHYFTFATTAALGALVLASITGELAPLCSSVTNFITSNLPCIFGFVAGSANASYEFDNKVLVLSRPEALKYRNNQTILDGYSQNSLCPQIIVGAGAQLLKNHGVTPNVEVKAVFTHESDPQTTALKQKHSELLINTQNVYETNAQKRNLTNWEHVGNFFIPALAVGVATKAGENLKLNPTDALFALVGATLSVFVNEDDAPAINNGIERTIKRTKNAFFGACGGVVVSKTLDGTTWRIAQSATDRAERLFRPVQIAVARGGHVAVDTIHEVTHETTTAEDAQPSA